MNRPSITTIIDANLSFEQRQQLTTIGFEAWQIGQDPEFAWTLQLMKWGIQYAGLECRS
jgi:hypothetical protein